MSAERRGLAVMRAVDEAAAGHAQVHLTGSGVHDLVVDGHDRALWLPDFLTSYAVRRAAGLVLQRLGEAPQSLGTLPGGEATAIRAVGADAHPCDVISSLVADLRGAAHPTLLVLDYLDLVLAPGFATSDLLLGLLLERLQALASDRQWRDLGHQVILVDRGGGITERLVHQPGYRTVRIDAPDAAETEIYLARKAAASSTSRLHLATGLDVHRAARLAGGLQLRDLAEVAALSGQHAPVEALTLATLKGEATRHRSNGTLELLDAAIDFGRDVTGLPAVRLHLHHLAVTGRNSARILLAGPPGTGKTYSAQAIARLLGVPLVSLGRIMGELLGQSERNLETALAVLRSMAPCALFIDEADQGPLGSRSAGSATSNEAYQALRQRLFTFLGDVGDDLGITVIATTNVPEHLDPAALDRFTVLPVLCPNERELVDVVRVQARRAGIALGEYVEHDLRAYLGSGKVITARTATKVVQAAHVRATERGSATVDGRDVERALGDRYRDDWTPSVEYSTWSSIVAAESRPALPWVAAAELGDSYEIPHYVRPYADAAGILDIDRIHARIATLKAAGAYAGR